jgi:serpin B
VKRLCFLLTVLALANTAAPGGAAATVPANYNGLGFALVGELSRSSENRNVFISPVSIGVAMAMVAEGASGDTRTGLLRGLGITGNALTTANAALAQSLRGNPDATIAMANALWLRADIPPNASYVKLLHDRYDADAQAVDFAGPGAAEKINAWTSQHTAGLISKIVDSTDSNDFAFLTNAITFQGKWTVPFERSDTHNGNFTDAAGQVERVSMMSKIASFKAYDGQTFSALRMTYGSGGAAAYVLLPKSGAIDAALKELGAQRFEQIAAAMRDSRIQVTMPRFTARYDGALNDVLKARGMGVAFGPHADFSRMRKPPPDVYIAKVRHASYVRVDEEGTVAAAATSVGMRLQSMQVAPKQFVVNRPFVLALRDERTGALLFLGVIKHI